ncbi:MAG: GNAT family N-acetyltransferase [Hyphomonas sp.]
MALISTLNTDRLVLQRVAPEHAEAVAENICDPRIYRNVSRIPSGQTLAQTHDWINSQANGAVADTDHTFAIMSDNHLTGMVGAHRQHTWEPFEIGYWLSPASWNQGFATEAGDEVIKWLESRGQFGAVSGYFEDNPASGRVLSKLDFMKAGRDVQFCLGRGEFVAHLHMARISETA